jgi:hypothetical protein
MKTVRNIALAIAAGSALALGIAAHAEEAKKPEARTPGEKQHMRGMHEHGMQGMREMRERCHGESRGRGEHQHS